MREAHTFRYSPAKNRFQFFSIALIGFDLKPSKYTVLPVVWPA
jgi:hypothetical protein